MTQSWRCASATRPVALNASTTPSTRLSIVDAGSVLFTLTPAGQLIVYQPSGKEFKEVAKYKVADRDTYAYPVVAGNRIYVKDETAVTLWTIE